VLKVVWRPAALDDLARLHKFLVTANPRAARVVLDQLKTAPRLLRTQPRIGKQLPEFAPREVRRLIVGEYELRYEVQPEAVLILRLWRTREDR
jgi:plasmid stabilization system protein ParE